MNLRAPTLTGYRDTYNKWGYLPDPEKFAMAAHEAAHAVVAGAVGCRVDRVAIESRANGHLYWDGVCEYSDPQEWDEDGSLVNRGVIVVAAYAGQQHLEGSVRWKLPDALLGGDTDDLREVVDQLDGAITYKAFRRQCLDIAERHLTNHAKAWRGVTYALMLRGSLDADDLAAIFPDLFTAEDPAPVRSARPSLSGMSQEQRNRVADALEKLLQAHAPSHGAPAYRVGNTTIETRVARPAYERRGVA